MICNCTTAASLSLHVSVFKHFVWWTYWAFPECHSSLKLKTIVKHQSCKSRQRTFYIRILRSIWSRALLKSTKTNYEDYREGLKKFVLNLNKRMSIADLPLTRPNWLSSITLLKCSLKNPTCKMLSYLRMSHPEACPGFSGETNWRTGRRICGFYCWQLLNNLHLQNFMLLSVFIGAQLSINLWAVNSILFLNVTI